MTQLGYVRTGETHRVPLKYVWYFIIKKNGDFDFTYIKDVAKYLKDPETKHIFAVWQGRYRTDLFLMDKKEILERIKKGID